GEWSCLFINSICNARCFYCPTEQPSKSEPMTNGIRFANPQDYADYIEKFNIRGVGLSGGEPLLTFDRTLQFLTKIKRRFGDTVHVWLYTNGILATREKFKRLKEAGLDEVRFDISANGYDLEKVREAVGLKETVTA
ncbi:MAG: radical SAM protein, partial [Desulfobacterales bacterium]|nr:radical SAM protein [Desulfobacterales bacterium]